MDKNKAIENILENLDFDKIHKVMTFLDWKWFESEEVPTIGKIVTNVQKHLSRTIDEALEAREDKTIKTGGFAYYATLDDKKELDYVQVIFELTSWEYYEDN
jgi:hypothetical protein